MPEAEPQRTHRAEGDAGTALTHDFAVYRAGPEQKNLAHVAQLAQEVMQNGKPGQ